MRKLDRTFSGTGSVFSGFLLNPEKCSGLSLSERRELVHEIAQWSKDAPEILQSWSRRELLEIICAEMGKERKYTGFTKFRMIEHLLNLVSNKSKKNTMDNSPTFPPVKRKRESAIQIPADLIHIPPEKIKQERSETRICQNLACKAILCSEDLFCKRCSCCICYHYDDNKDPSLWLTCNSDPPYEDVSCGLSYHLNCALKHEEVSILNNGCFTRLDGCLYCVSCGKVNGLMRTFRKQLLVAKDARRVDVLCLRISLSQKILKGTEKYKELMEIIENAAKKLEREVGSLDRVSAKMARGIVNRLSCGVEVQNLCTSAIEALNSMFSRMFPGTMDHKESPTCQIMFEEALPTSVIITLEYEHNQFEEFLGCRLWHRKSSMNSYPSEPTFIVLRPEKRFKIGELRPSTEYFCKVSLFSPNKTLGNWEAKWVTPASNRSFLLAIDEKKHKREENTFVAQAHSQIDSTNSSNTKLRSLNDINKNKKSKSQLELSSNENQEVEAWESKKGVNESDYEYSVRVIRGLERDGHIDRDFRVKFLTWFSLKATVQERRVVNAFVDALIDEPSSLAGQLIDTFTDMICSEQKPVSRHEFCAKLWN